MGTLSRAQKISFITAIVLIWGVSWPIYKIALHYTPSILFAGMRTLLGGLLLTLVILPRYKSIQIQKNWKVYLTTALFNGVLFYGLQTVGLQYVPEGLFTVLVYLQPVLVGLFAWIWLQEKLTVFKLIGLFLGFIGVSIISITSISGHVSLLGIGLALVTAVSWAIGTVYIKKFGSQMDAYWLVAFQCLLSGIVMTVVGLYTEPFSAIVWNSAYLTGLLFGAIFGIPISWVLFFTLVRSGDASKIASFTFLVPLIAILSGVLFLHESLSIYLLIGLVFIISSIYLVNRKH